MKSLLRVGLAATGLLAIVSLSMSVSLARSLYNQASGDGGQRPNYHFSLYLPDNINTFFAGIVAGAELAASETGSVLSLHSIEPHLNELEMASYTGVDGVVVCPYLDDKLARRQLEKLGAKKIPVVLINHNVPADQPWPYIGTNNFEVGRKLGTIAGRASRGPLSLAVVYSDKSPGMFGERELVEMGISSSIGERLASPIVGFKTSMNPLDAEALLVRLFRTHPSVNTVIFTDSSDTLAAAQLLIDMNLVGKVQVVGFGDESGILDYIRKGVIAGAVAVNPERIGYEALMSLFSLRSTGYTSTSIDTGVDIIDGSKL